VHIRRSKDIEWATNVWRSVRYKPRSASFEHQARLRTNIVCATGPLPNPGRFNYFPGDQAGDDQPGPDVLTEGGP
jgi:hypothetical protein